MDQSVTDITGLGFWLVLDGDISAPECLPIGSCKGHERFGPTYYKNFFTRSLTMQQRAKLDELADRLIREVNEEFFQEEKAAAALLKANNEQ